jgi:hypothetical protein
MSVGQLRVRIRAYQRETTWAPRYVANELAGTRQAADRHRRDTAVRRAEANAVETTHAPADRATDAEWRAQRLREAEEAEALAAALDARAAELAAADEARAQWYAHTAETRAVADRARAELTARSAAGALGADEPAVTAKEWLQASEAAARAEDPHREITAEHELSDLETERDRDRRAARADTADQVPPTATIGEPEPAPIDIRQQPERHAEQAAGIDSDPGSATEAAAATDTASDTDSDTDIDTDSDVVETVAAPRRGDDHPTNRHEARDEDTVRVPSPDETAESVRRARRALAELRQREAIEEHRANDEAARDDELARWHTDDPHTGTAADSQARDTGTTGARGSDSAPRADEAGDAGPVLDRAR